MKSPNGQLHVVVLDMQPITPTIGGGRARLLGAFHNLHPNITCTYVGSFDWKGEPARTKQLTPSLRENLLPLSDEHFEALNYFQSGTGSQTIIDSLFHLFAPLSRQYVDAALQAIENADAVVFEHPWIFPCVEHALAGKTVFYDSQNVEVILKQKGFSRTALGEDFVRIVAGTEASVISRADHIFACSLEDKNVMSYVYDTPIDKISVAPNGVFVDDIKPKSYTKTSLASGDPVAAIFIGSNYGPNIEAARCIVQDIAPKNRAIQFFLLGGIAEHIDIRTAASQAPNITLIGIVSDEDKGDWLRRADIAINPMFTGSGTNIKMFDFMAHGLPVITTSVGARGIASESTAGITVCEPADFSSVLAQLAQSASSRETAGLENRRLVESKFSWESISRGIGTKILSVSQGRTPAAVQTKLVAPSPRVTFPPKKFPISIMSTYGIKCGIAGYTEYLTQALGTQGTEVAVYAATTPDEPSGPKQFTPLVRTAWHWDNITWISSKVDTDLIISGAQTHGNHLNVQYHPAFFSIDVLCEVLTKAKFAGLSTSVTLHNALLSENTDLIRISDLCAVFFVHDEPSASRIKALGRRACVLDHGVPDVRTIKTLSTSREREVPFQIGTFGYMRPHKGFWKVISAISLVRKVYPQTSLVALCAMSDNVDAQKALDRCRSEIDTLGLQDVVELDVSHHDTDHILTRLSHSSVNVLAYAESKEGASGAANMCLGSRVPLMVSRSSIFDPLKDCVIRFEDNSPLGIAANILNVLGNRALARVYAERVNDYVDAHGWDEAASVFKQEILRLHERS